MVILYFLLASYGMTNILLFGHIFDKIRPKRKFFKCPMCMGFWVGVFLTLCFGLPFTFNSYLDLFIGGLISSGFSYFMINLLDDDGIKIKRS